MAVRSGSRARLPTPSRGDPRRPPLQPRAAFSSSRGHAAGADCAEARPSSCEVQRLRPSPVAELEESRAVPRRTCAGAAWQCPRGGGGSCPLDARGARCSCLTRLGRIWVWKSPRSAPLPCRLPDPGVRPQASPRAPQGLTRGLLSTVAGASGLCGLSARVGLPLLCLPRLPK